MILKAVENERRGIDTLFVKFRFDVADGGTKDDRARYQSRVVVRGHDAARQILVDRTYGPRDDSLYHQRIAFNGKFSCWYQEFNQVGGLMPGLLPSVDDRNEAFFALNMLSDPQKSDSGNARVDGSLLAMLRSVYTSVRPRMEQVDVPGSPMCCVLDNGGWFHTDMTVWLDPARGFLPVKQKIYGDKRNPVTEWDLEKAEQVAGKWIATQGREIRPDGTVVQMNVLRAGNKADGPPEIVLNDKLPDDYFDLWKTLPIGTRVFNQAANRTYVVGQHGELNVFSEGKDVGGEEVSPDLHGGFSHGVGLQRVLAVVAVPALFLVGSLLTILIGSWITIRRGADLG